MKFITNQTTAKAKRITHNGTEYLVAPTIAIVEGVMNELLYTEDEMTRYIEVWNGKPLPIMHPQDQAGNFISANSPDQHARSLGNFYNAKFEGGKLKGEWWIDIEKTKGLGVKANEVMRRLEFGEMVEQSTGLFLDEEPSEGVWNGKAYKAIARNIRPDHVAILLDEPGACSIADGCGTPRVNSEQSPPNSGDDIAAKVINYFKSLFNNQEQVMDKQETIDALVANEACPFDAEYLQNASDDQLKGLETLLTANEPNTPEPKAPAANVDTEVEGEKDEGPKAPETPDVVTEFTSLIEELGGVAALKETLNGLKANSDGQRQALVSQITANTQFSEDELKSMSLAQLQKMADAVKPKPSGFQLRPSSVVNNDDSEWVAYEAPKAAMNGKAGK